MLLARAAVLGSVVLDAQTAVMFQVNVRRRCSSLLGSVVFDAQTAVMFQVDVRRRCSTWVCSP